MSALPDPNPPPPPLIVTTSTAPASPTDQNTNSIDNTKPPTPTNTTSTSKLLATATLSPPSEMLSPSRSSASPTASNKRPRPDDDDDDNDENDSGNDSNNESGHESDHKDPSLTAPSTAVAQTHASPVPAITHHKNSVPTTTPKTSRHTGAPTKKVLERNQACLDCRRRKRKCDGEKPACHSCAKLGRKCEYQANPVTKIHANTGSSVHKPTHSSPPGRMGSSPSPSASHAAGGAGRIETSPNPPASSSSSGAAVVRKTSAFTAVNTTTESPSAATAASRSSAHHLDAPRIHVTNGAHNGRGTGSGAFRPPASLGVTDSSGKAAADIFDVRFFQPSSSFDPASIDFSLFSHAKAAEDEKDEKMIQLDDEDMPSQDVIHELFELFFEKVHVLLPCLFRKQVMEDLANGGQLSRPNTLTYAILAIAGYLHPRASIKQASDVWALDAKASFDNAIIQGKYSQLAVQGGVYIALRMLGLAHMHELWPFLGQVWRMCQPLGFNVLDKDGPFKGWLPLARSEQEIEERRRTMWAVYILDRIVSVMVPWSMNIIDDEFCVNFPASEEVFQSESLKTAESMIVDPFPRSLDQLAPKRHPSHQAPDLDPYQHLCKIAVLIGRITTHTHRVDICSTSSNPNSSADPYNDRDTLNNMLTHFLLIIPRQIRRPPSTSHPTLSLLLNVILCASRAWLHRPSFPRKASDTLDSDAYDQCSNAASGVLNALSNAVTQLDPADEFTMANPLLVPALWTTTKILALKSKLEGRAGNDVESRKAKEGTEIIASVFDRMADCWPRLAGLMNTLLEREVEADS